MTVTLHIATKYGKFAALKRMRDHQIKLYSNDCDGTHSLAMLPKGKSHGH